MIYIYRFSTATPPPFPFAIQQRIHEYDWFECQIVELRIERRTKHLLCSDEETPSYNSWSNDNISLFHYTIILELERLFKYTFHKII